MNPSLSTKEQAELLSRLTRELARCCMTKEEKIFAKFDLNMANGRVLLTVAESGTATPSGLAKTLGLGRSRLTPLVDSLVRSGFLRRVESEADRRVRTLTMTATGQRVAREVAEYHLNFHSTLLRKFKPEEREQLLSALSHLREAIEELRETI